jgi:hypothetical protein
MSLQQENQATLTPEDLAEMFGVARDMIIRWALADYGPPVHVVDNQIRYRLDEVMEWSARNNRRLVSSAAATTSDPAGCLSLLRPTSDTLGI